MKQNGIMMPGVPKILKIRATTGDNMLESLILEAERASRCSGERPFTDIFLSSESIVVTLVHDEYGLHFQFEQHLELALYCNIDHTVYCNQSW